MAAMFEKRHKVVERGWGRSTGLKSTVKFRTMAMVSNEELIQTLNKYNTKPKMKAKILTELQKRGVKLVWK